MSRISIVGGGIAGLSLALSLKDRGVSATVYEGVPEVKPLGVGITLLPHAMRELAALGVDKAIEAMGIENYESSFYTRHGQHIYSELRGRHAGYPQPEIGIHRGNLHRILYEAALKRCGADAIKTDHKLAHITQDDAGVTLNFENGAKAQSDIVIACDGIHSRVRQAFYPDEPLAFAGINTWRGVTRRAPILGGKTYLRIGSIHTGKMVVYPIVNYPDGTQLINWMAEIEGDAKVMNDWNLGGQIEDFLPIYASWTFDWLDVPELIKNADKVLQYPMVDRDPIPQWTFGRITLAGDAAHPMYPRGSNGAAQAIIDGRTLAELLAPMVASGSDLRPALHAYEAARRDTTSKIVRTNRSTPPDIINITVEERSGDKPFGHINEVISPAELRGLSEQYKQVAGFALAK